MMNLIKAFYNSLYNPEWLKRQKHATGKAFAYFSLFILFVSILTTGVLSVVIYPELKNTASDFSKNFPDFEAKFQKGALTVQKLPQPFIFNLSDKSFGIVVDTVSETSKDFSEYVSSTPEVSILVTKSKMELAQNDGVSRTQKWNDIPDSNFNKADVTSAMKDLLSPLYYTIGSLLLFVGIYIGYFVGRLYTILVVALVVSVMARSTRREMSLKELMTIGLYAVTLPTILTQFILLTGIQIPYLNFIATLSFMIAIILTVKPKIIEEEN